jgi:hypothetical protein
MMLPWLPLLAQIPAHSAGTDSFDARAGDIIGTIIGKLLIFGIVVALIALVSRTAKPKAPARQTSGPAAPTQRSTFWWIAVSIGGVLVFVVIAFVIGIGAGILSQYKRPFSKTRTETITGKAVPYTIAKPAGWSARRDIKGYDVLLTDSSGYVSVSGDPRNYGSSDSFAKVARQRISSIGPGAVLGNNQIFQIDGHTWVGFTALAHSQNQNFSYLCYVYSGPEGSVQLTGWGPQNDWTREGPILGEVMRSFRFPPVVTAAARP